MALPINTMAPISSPLPRLIYLDLHLHKMSHATTKPTPSDDSEAEMIVFVCTYLPLRLKHDDLMQYRTHKER